jgi:hypothetical protein
VTERKLQYRSRLIKIGVLTFIVGIILFFPARVAYQWFAPAELSLSGISGSVWSGRAREGDANGIYLRDLQWHIRPLDFVTLKLGFAVSTMLASGFIEGNIAIGVTGSIVARDISASVPLRTLQTSLGMPGLQGSLSAQFDVLKLEAGLPVTADGVLEVSNLIAPLIDRNSITKRSLLPRNPEYSQVLKIPTAWLTWLAVCTYQQIAVTCS